MSEKKRWKGVKYGFGWEHPDKPGTEVIDNVLEDIYKTIDQQEARIAEFEKRWGRVNDTTKELVDTWSGKLKVKNERIFKLETVLRETLDFIDYKNGYAIRQCNQDHGDMILKALGEEG